MTISIPRIVYDDVEQTFETPRTVMDTATRTIMVPKTVMDKKTRQIQVRASALLSSSFRVASDSPHSLPLAFALALSNSLAVAAGPADGV